MTGARLSTIKEDEDDKLGLATLNNHFENYLNKVKILANINIDLRQKFVQTLQTYLTRTANNNENDDPNSNTLEMKFNNLRRQLNEELRKLITTNTRLQRADYDKKYYIDKIRLFSNSDQNQIVKQQCDSSLYELNLLKEQYMKQEENLQTCKKQYNDYIQKLIVYTDEYNKITFERIQTENSLYTLNEQLVFEREYDRQYQLELKSLEKIQYDTNDKFNRTEFQTIILKIRQDYQKYNEIQLSELEVYYKIKLDLVQYNFQDTKKKENHFEEIEQLREQNTMLQRKLIQLQNNFNHIIERNRQQYELFNDEYSELDVQVYDVESFIFQSRNNTVKLSSEIKTYRCLLINLASSFQQPIKSSTHRQKPNSFTVHYRDGLLCVRI